MSITAAANAPKALKKRKAAAEAAAPAGSEEKKAAKATRLQNAVGSDGSDQEDARISKKQKVSAEAGTAAKAAGSSDAAPSKGQPVVMDATAYRKQHDITVKQYGAGAPELYQRFEDAPFPESLQKALKAAGFVAPSPIQAQAWPLALTGRDLLATAKTGSGKTCGYLLPAIARLLKENPGVVAAPGSRPPRGSPGTPSILVMAPTRELALQIQEQAATFGRAAGLRSVAIYGGAPKGPQIRDVHSGAQLVIATPGRLNDLMAFQCQDGSSVLTLDQARVLVLDEADRMCDMGFEDDIRKIVAKMPSTKQTLFFTATWPKAVARVAGSILRNPIHVSIGNCDELCANKDIKQVVRVVDGRDKSDQLAALIKQEVGTPQELSSSATPSRTIIFANKKYMCDQIESNLWEAGYNIAAIHGDKSQQEREWALGQMRAGKLPLLVATDVAARGLDIKGMDRVINFDFPNGTEDYVHRIGRTGRAGASGVAHTFFTAADAKQAGELVKILRDAQQEVPAALEALVRGQGGAGGGAGGKWGGNKWGGSRWGRGSSSGGQGGGGKQWGGKKKW